MKTEIIKIDLNCIEADKLKYAGDVLKAGGLVAFPTETVYGLGANALESEAVKKIFEAKGRPSDNPLIIHISEEDAVYRLVKEVPANAALVMEKFWPGPVTLVMQKSEIIPHEITAGLDTVAVRMPSHPVALELIRQSGIPIAAPSANTSGKPSPTCARHVIDDLTGKVDIILDAGNAKVGVESTVLDVTSVPPMILRPGGITREQLKEVLGKIQMDPALKGKGLGRNVTPKAPGMKYTHYSPEADVIIVEGELGKVAARIQEMADIYKAKGKSVGILATEQTIQRYKIDQVINMGDRKNPETIASGLFSALREFDRRKVDIILAEAVDEAGIGFAVMNRMVKAAGYQIITID